MSYDEFIELNQVKKLFDELHALREEIAIMQDRLHSLKKKKSEIYEKIGEIAEEYEAEPFFKN